ncbi:MAG: hypothetical protein GAK43_01369 [Stenotrophomonas maltophilia]|nr:MAG: hypothetical protein GAK43_01369 [Stenotrophomonas maltophilia]
MILRRLLLLTLLLCAAGAGQAATIAVPTLNARVTDLTQTFGNAQRQQLEQRLAALEQAKGAQLAVLMVPTTGDDSIEQFATRVFEQWKLGHKGVDDGVLLIVAKNDHTLRIEVGYGLEGTITDVQAGRIIRDSIVPHFKQGDFAGGVQAGVDDLIGLIDPQPQAAEANPPSASTDLLPAPVISAPGSDTSEPYQLPPQHPPAGQSVVPTRLIGMLGLLLGVPLLGMLLPLPWMRQRRMPRYLLCSLAVGGLAALGLLFIEVKPGDLQSNLIGAFGIPLVVYIFILPPMWLTLGVLQLLWMIITSIGSGRGGGGGGSSGGGGFRGGGGSSGGGGASGRW